MLCRTNSLCINEEVIKQIIDDVEPSPELLIYTFKAIHILLLKNPHKITPSKGMQSNIINWHKTLKKKLLTRPLFFDSV